MSIEFRKITNDSRLEKSAEVIRDSFKTVADDFNITREKAPTNPAFIEPGDLIKMREKGIEMFGVYDGLVQIGFVAIEKAEGKVYYMEKLAVLPPFRHNGYGKRIIEFVVDHVRLNCGEKISIGVINDNTVLKEWYKNSGFVETGVRKFKHLPFEVCFMEKVV